MAKGSMTHISVLYVRLFSTYIFHRFYKRYKLFKAIKDETGYITKPMQPHAYFLTKGILQCKGSNCNCISATCFTFSMTILQITTSLNTQQKTVSER